MKVQLASIFLTACLAATPALAQNCTAQPTTIAFGSYQPLTNSPTNTVGTVTVTCNPGAVSILVSYAIGIGPGTGGTVAARSLGGMAGRLPYQLYTDVLHTTIWGDGTGGSVPVSDGYLLSLLAPVSRNYSAYGQITGGTPAAVGVYSDTLIITVSY